jgi:glutamate 5-kinase
VVTEILEGHGVGTRFQAQAESLNARRRWIAGLRTKGSVWVDAGAIKALVEGKKSLLPSGVTRTQGDFDAGDAVRVLGPDGREVARGLAAYASADVRKILGRKTSELPGILNRPRPPQEVLHRNNLAVLG